jgi:hypothetical protein
MDNIIKWLDFMKSAQVQLLKGQSIDNYKPNIQIAIEPSFDNSIFLQLLLNDKDVEWYRTTWLRLTDAPKFSDPIESLKYIGKNIEPAIKYENGTIEKKCIIDIISFIKTISVKPRIEKWSGIMLDGIYYTLTIGTESMLTTYKWHYLPDEWTDLQTLTRMIEELNKKLLR